jgi:predicted flap endonuclease-1-like 5' DNA nuclease
MKLPRFVIGLLIGGLLGVIIWYWQKSTSAEDGALDLLDRLAVSEARTRDLERRLHRTVAPAASEPDPIPPQQAAMVDSASDDTTTPEADDLQAISGIGPTYARRLQEAGIQTFADLAGATPSDIIQITGARGEETVRGWIDEAQRQLAG